LGVVIYLASSTPSPTASMSPSDGSGGGFDPAWIALLGVLIGLVVQTVLQNRGARDAARRDVAKALLDHHTRQLDELYGPILPLLEQSRRLYKKLGKPTGWRMLDHIDEVLASDEEKLIVMRILEIGEQIESILLSKASLARPPGPPESFNLYIGHVAVLRLMLRGGLRRDPLSDEYYPRHPPNSFNDDIEVGYHAILEELERMRASQRNVTAGA
jgi:hypothetical protein